MNMKNKNMSDIIESYLKQILQQEEHVEISRSEIADQFQCVPSQINYVINTRFTKGYLVEVNVVGADISALWNWKLSKRLS